MHESAGRLGAALTLSISVAADKYVQLSDIIHGIPRQSG